MNQEASRIQYHRPLVQYFFRWHAFGAKLPEAMLQSTEVFLISKRTILRSPLNASALARNDHTLLAKSDPPPPHFGVTSASRRADSCQRASPVPAQAGAPLHVIVSSDQATRPRKLNTLRSSGADAGKSPARLRRG